MKILSTQQIRAADAYTIEHEPIASVDLMERAGNECAAVIEKFLKPGKKVLVFAGQGNNGGDGLVIARLLGKRGFDVSVVVAAANPQGSKDFEINLVRLEATGVDVFKVEDNSQMPDIRGYQLAVDALFGSGLKRPVRGLYAKVIEAINNSNVRVVSIDIPSGLFADCHSDPEEGAIVKADITLSLELPKLALLMPENYKYTGEWRVVPIGLSSEFIHEVQTDHTVFTFHDAAEIFRPRVRVAHKGNYGHGLLLAGSRDKAGAALLAAHSTLRSGAGLLTTHIPAGIIAQMNMSLPEAMVSADENAGHLSALPDLKPYTAVAAGPGIGTRPETVSMVKNLLKECSSYLVLDADALNILASNPGWLKELPAETILTPHLKEFDRLAGSSANSFERLDKAKEFATRHRCYLVLKSAWTAMVSPEGDCSFNIFGNAGLAKGGSGDALTGIILGLLCRGYSPGEASKLAVFLHARAAEICAEKTGLDAILASDVYNTLGAVFKSLEKVSANL